MDPQGRQAKSFALRGISLTSTERAKLVVMQSDTTKARLGLSIEQWAYLQEKVTHVIHNAWPMNGMKPLASFEGQFCVLRNLIDLARDIGAIQSTPVRFHFISSIGTVNGGGALEKHTEIEKVMSNGYNEAKFVCERVVQETLQKFPAIVQATIVRPGQIASSTETGHWNTSEHFPAIVKSSQSVGAFPALQGRMGWTPVNIAASIIADLLLDEDMPAEIYHVDNPLGQEWASVVDVLANELGVTKVPFKDWIERVREYGSSKENPAGVMVDWLEKNFERMSCRGPLDTCVARKHSRTLREMEKEEVVGAEQVRKFVCSWKERGFLS